MAEVVRKRLVLPVELLALQDSSAKGSQEAGQAQTPTREFIRIAELLADYRDVSAIPQMEALLDTLARTPAEKLWAEYEEPPSWFIRMALGRIKNPAFGAVFRPAGDGKRQFAREGSEIEAVQIRSSFFSSTWWCPVEIDPSLVRDILVEFGASETIDLGSIYRQHTEYYACLRIRFADGVASILTADKGGFVHYDDNTRESDSPVYSDNPSLAGWIVGMVRTISMQGLDFYGR